MAHASLSHWLSPRYGGQLWFDKPPLFYWLTALSMRLFGRFRIRRPPAVGGAVRRTCRRQLCAGPAGVSSYPESRALGRVCSGDQLAVLHAGPRCRDGHDFGRDFDACAVWPLRLDADKSRPLDRSGRTDDGAGNADQRPGRAGFDRRAGSRVPAADPAGQTPACRLRSGQASRCACLSACRGLG